MIDRPISSSCSSASSISESDILFTSVYLSQEDVISSQVSRLSINGALISLPLFFPESLQPSDRDICECRGLIL